MTIQTNSILFNQIAEVIGEECALLELRAIPITEISQDQRVGSAFSWRDTPQGHGFWYAISHGRVPRTYIENST